MRKSKLKSLNIRQGDMYEGFFLDAQKRAERPHAPPKDPQVDIIVEVVDKVLEHLNIDYDDQELKKKSMPISLL